MIWCAGKIRSHALSTVLRLLSQSKSLEETSESHKTIDWIAKHDMANKNHKMNHERFRGHALQAAPQYESVNAIRFYCCEAALKIHPPKNKFMLPLSPLKPMVLKTNSATTNISPLHLSLNISKQFNSFSSQHVAMYHWCTSRSFHPVEPFLWKTQQGNSSFNVLEVMIYWAEIRDKLLANIALNFALQDYTSIV